MGFKRRAGRLKWLVSEKVDPETGEVRQHWRRDRSGTVPNKYSPKKAKEEK